MVLAGNRVVHVALQLRVQMVTCHQVCHQECHQMVDIQTAHTRHQADIQPLREAIVAVHQDPVRQDPAVQNQIPIQRHLHRHHRLRNI